MISFEYIIPGDKIKNTFEDYICDKMNLIRVDSLEEQKERAGSLQMVLIVPDDLPEKKVKKLTEKYGSEVILVSALWFYFSVLYMFELPLEPFTHKNAPLSTTAPATVLTTATAVENNGKEAEKNGEADKK